MAALIEERPHGLPAKPAFDELLELRRRIEDIKAHTAGARLERLEAELARLKVESPQDYRRIAAGMARETGG